MASIFMGFSAVVLLGQGQTLAEPPRASSPAMQHSTPAGRGVFRLRTRTWRHLTLEPCGNATPW
jgi:hypothetical protein